MNIKVYKMVLEGYFLTMVFVFCAPVAIMFLLGGLDWMKGNLEAHGGILNAKVSDFRLGPILRIDLVNGQIVDGTMIDYIGPSLDGTAIPSRSFEDNISIGFSELQKFPIRPFIIVLLIIYVVAYPLIYRLAKQELLASS